MNGRAFYLNAGFALEHALKASLAAVHPTLIADRRDFDSMLLLAREQISVPHVAPSLRTVAFGQCVENAAKVVPNITGLKKDLIALGRHRNAVAHVGATSSSTTSDDVKTFLTAMLAAVSHLNVDVSEFFGQFAEFMSTRLDELAEAEQQEVAGLKAAARVRFDQQFAEGFPSKDYASVLHSAEWAKGDRFQLAECPVCGTNAVMEGELFVDADVDFEYEDGQVVVSGAASWVDFTPTTFYCRACGLVLADRHLAAAGLADSWVLDDVDPETVDGGMPVDLHEFRDYEDDPY